MTNTPDCVLVIPARDECESVGAVVREALGYVSRVIVVDNGSKDETDGVARAAGATVLHCERMGYGAACETAVEFLSETNTDPVVVFMVADGSDDPREIESVVRLVREGRAELVVGSRTRGRISPGAMTAVQRAGSLFAAGVLSLRFGERVTDLGPFRAARVSTLVKLGLKDRTYGWTIEMQVKAFRAGLRVTEVPVSWRNRTAGEQKVTGTLKGSLGATVKILAWLIGAVGGEKYDPR